jgi:hypothetical protein
LDITREALVLLAGPTVPEAARDAAVAAAEAGEHVTKGELAMGIALLYPDGGKPAPGRKDPAATEAENVSVSMTRIKQARQVLRHSPDLARAVRDGVRKLDDALDLVRREQEATITDEIARETTSFLPGQGVRPPLANSSANKSTHEALLSTRAPGFCVPPSSSMPQSSPPRAILGNPPASTQPLSVR